MWWREESALREGNGNVPDRQLLSHAPSTMAAQEGTEERSEGSVGHGRRGDERRLKVSLSKVDVNSSKATHSA